MYCLAADVSSVETGYGLVLLDAGRGEYYNLNPSGTLVLRSILRSGTVADAASGLMSEYAVDQATAERDARNIVADLVAARLLTPVEAAADERGTR